MSRLYLIEGRYYAKFENDPFYHEISKRKAWQMQAAGECELWEVGCDFGYGREHRDIAGTGATYSDPNGLHIYSDSTFVRCNEDGSVPDAESCYIMADKYERVPVTVTEL